MKNYTLIWMDDTLNVGIETYTAASKEDAVDKWDEDTTDCTLVGVLAGEPEILYWET